MARRGRRGGGKKRAANPLSQWGYPTNKRLRREAGAYANAAVPTVRATTRPYTRQQQQVSGWLRAVTDALTASSGQAQQAYSSAEAAQVALDQAAQARLAGLGLGDFGTGVQAAQGARGDSAAANLLSRGAAAGAYAAAQPGVATGYANVQHATVQKGLRDALAQRRDLRAQAVAQGMQQAQSNAMTRASFLAGRQDAASQVALQRQQMQIQQSQFQQSLALQQHQAQLDEYYHSPDYLRQVQAIQSGASSAGRAGLTPTEYRTQMSAAHDILYPKAKTQRIPQYGPNGHIIGYRQVTVKGADQRDMAQRGVPFATALERLQTQGINRQIALRQLATLYSRYANAKRPRNLPPTYAGGPRGAAEGFISFLQWLRDNRIDRSTPVHDVGAPGH